MKIHAKTFVYNFFLLLLASLTLLIPVRRAWAQEATPSADEVNRIASQLYCPVCENIPLDECATEACDAWRDLIRTRLAEGWTDDEIKDYFVAQYGDRVLGDPPRRGLNWLLYLLPPTVILVGLALMLSKLKRHPKQQQKDDFEAKDPYLEKVERDLRNMDE